MLCKNCGNQLFDDKILCTKCGMKTVNAKNSGPANRENGNWKWVRLILITILGLFISLFLLSTILFLMAPIL